MNYIDLLFIIIFIWSAYKGFTKGFIIAIASLIALIIGIFGAIKFSGFTAGLLSDKFDMNAEYLDLIAFAITFVLIVIGVHFLARLLDKLAEAVALGFANRIAGVMFNLLKSAFIISVILVVLNEIDKNVPFLPKKHIAGSILYKPLSALAPTIFPYLKFEYKKIEKNFKHEDEILAQRTIFIANSFQIVSLQKN